MQDKKMLPIIGIQHRHDVRPFTEEEVRFEIDMCIGCDRCMRACPVPMSSTVTIADLNKATITDDVPAHVARFTDECVMCASCAGLPCGQSSGPLDALAEAAAGYFMGWAS